MSGVLATPADVLVAQIPGTGACEVTLTHVFAACDPPSFPSELLPPEVPITGTWTAACDLCASSRRIPADTGRYVFGALLFYAHQQALPVLLPDQDRVTFPTGRPRIARRFVTHQQGQVLTAMTGCARCWRRICSPAPPRTAALPTSCSKCPSCALVQVP